MLPDIQPGNTKILYFFNCLLDGMHTNLASGVRLPCSLTNQNFRARIYLKELDKAVCKISKLLYNK